MTKQDAEPRPSEPTFDRYATLETTTETIIYDVENRAAWVSSDAVVPLDDAR